LKGSKFSKSIRLSLELIAVNNVSLFFFSDEHLMHVIAARQQKKKFKLRFNAPTEVMIKLFNFAILFLFLLLFAFQLSSR